MDHTNDYTRIRINVPAKITLMDQFLLCLRGGASLEHFIKNKASPSAAGHVDRVDLNNSNAERFTLL